ncbi:MAG: hypothetical protein IPJ34_34140 [Myxococcales bacterium]|nr:hypothetical protein [Myxococcales bacterium]
MRKLSFALVLSPWLVACSASEVSLPADEVGVDGSIDGAIDGGDTAVTDAPTDAPAKDPRAALEAAGFVVGNGSFELLDLSGCCAKGSSCFGNNPTSPYASYRLPRAPGQTIANPGERSDGTSTRWFLRPDEAVVWLGTLPPKAKYFGFTNYLFGRVDTAGKRAPVFASLDETLNEAVIGHEGTGAPYGQVAAVIHTADTGTAAKVRAALVAAGVSNAAINVAPIDAVSSHPGLVADADDYSVLFRVALFEDKAAGTAWLDKPPAKLFRVTPGTLGTVTPYGLPTARAKDLAAVEGAALASATEDLEKAVVAKYAATHTPTSFPVDEGQPDPYACIAGKATCAGDNRDALYPKTNIPFRWLESEDDFLVVMGVDHTVTGKATYTSASVYAVDNLVGIASVTSAEWAGSAKDYLPTHAEVGKLFAWKIARKCGGEAHCLEIPAGDCPTGMTAGQFAAIAFRVYVEPKTATAPAPSTLVRERVVRFRKK